MNSGKNKQHGASFVGVLFVGAALAFAGIVGAQGVPADVEVRMIGQTADKLKVARTTAKIRSNFDQTALVDDIKFIASNGLAFTKEGTPSLISFDASKEIHLATSAFLLTKYMGRSH